MRRIGKGGMLLFLLLGRCSGCGDTGLEGDSDLDVAEVDRQDDPADRGEIEGAACGNGIVEAGESCDTTEERECATSCGSSGVIRCEDCEWTACLLPGEVCNGVDDDCDGTVPPDELDADGDGYSPCEGDCDDHDELVDPGAVEVCNGVDDDCDPATRDGDGEPLAGLPCDEPGTVWACVFGVMRCRDPEICDGLDNDMDGEVDESCPCADGWVSEPLDTADRMIRDLWGSSGDHVFGVGPAGSSAAVVYNGRAWEASGDAPAFRCEYGVLDVVRGLSADDVLAFGTTDDVGMTDIPGCHWPTLVRYRSGAWDVEPDPPLHVRAAWSPSSESLIAVGGDAIWRFDGVGWETMLDGAGSELAAVWGRSGDDVFAVGDDGTILHYDGSGWAPSPSGTTAYLRGAWGAPGGDVFVVGKAGTILRHDGSGWSPMESGTEVDLVAVWGASDRSVLAVGCEEVSDDVVVLAWDGVEWGSERVHLTLSEHDRTLFCGSDCLDCTMGRMLSIWGTSVNNVFVAVRILGPRYESEYESIVLHRCGVGW